MATATVALARQPASKPRGGPAPTTVTVDKIQTKLREIDANQDLDATLKTQIIDLYKQAQSRLKDTVEYATTTASYQQAIASAPAEIDNIRKTLGRPQATPVTPADMKLTGLSFSDLEQRQIQEEADFAVQVAKLADLEKQLQEQQGRPDQARDELREARQKLQATEERKKAPPPPDEAPALTEANKLAREGHSLARSKQIRMLEQELVSHGVRLQLLTAQRDLASRQVSQAQDRVKVLKDLLTHERQIEAERAQQTAERAEAEAAGKHPVIREQAERNAELSRELTEVIEKLGRTAAGREATDKQLQQIAQDFQSARQKLDIAGLSQALGQVLREQRRDLPDVRRYQRETKKRQQEIASLGLAQIKVDEDRRALAQLDSVAERIMKERVDAAVPETQRRNLESELRKLLKDQQALLDKLADAGADYLRALGELDFAHRQLVDNAEQYAAFLDERLLWIPSAQAMGLETVTQFAAAIGWLGSPEHWGKVGSTLILELGRAPIAAILLVAVFVGWLAIHRRLRAILEAIAERVSKPYSDQFIYTLQALALTVLSAAPWALFIGFLGWRLLGALETSEFVRAVGNGLIDVAVPLFFLQMFWSLCRSHGVAEIHFHWQQGALLLLRRHLSWLMAIGLPAVFINSMADWQTEAAYRDGLGRVAFMTIMIALSVFLQRILRPTGGALEQPLKNNPRGLLARLRRVWYPAGVGLPVVLALLAAIGYHYTALQLAHQLIATVWLFISAVIGHDLVIRWLTLQNRKLALIKAKEKREAQRLAETAAGPSEAPPAALDIHEVDIPRINEQTRHLLWIVIGMSIVVGLWMIWAQVLPALAILNNVSLWQHTVAVDGHEVLKPITLANLALAVVFAVIATAAAHNLPGVLQIVLRQRLAIEPGSRYAITQVARYVIVTIGIIVVFNALGGNWSQVQWLVAAVGVGLGFGLQEIFANFVSGLIILFERPIRVGDTVTVGDVTGAVSRIRIRSTTITDGDRRELVVPNKTFITDRVINWTLSDRITRLVLKVGIGHGSDVALGHKVILDVVRSSPMVLQDPEPNVSFVGFGENALNFEIYAFVAELGQRLPLTHQLHVGIHEALREHNIEIPYPQREIHLRSAVPVASSSDEPRTAASQRLPDGGGRP